MVKPIGEFWANPGTTDGHQGQCKACASDYNKQYYADRQEHEKARTRKWHDENPEKSAAASKKFFKNHPGYQKARYWKDPERARSAAKTSNLKHPGRRAASASLRYWSDPETHRAGRREWMRAHYVPKQRKPPTYSSHKEYYLHWKRNNPDRRNHLERERKARKHSNGGSHTIAEWRCLVFLCGFACLCCGQIKKLQADHIIPVIKGGTNHIHNTQPLCGTCNFRKHAKAIDYRPRKIRYRFRDRSPVVSLCAA